MVPTLMVLAKALGFGLPLVAVTGRAEVIDALPVAWGHPWGHPVACAASVAGLDAMAAENCIAEARRRGAKAIERLRNLQHVS